MDPLTSLAAAGMRSRMESLDMLANNIANASTEAYKADREFYSTYMSAQASAAETDSGAMPVIERAWTDFSLGTLRQTGNPLHLAIGSNAFFAVNGPSGPIYTRSGRLQISSAGELETPDGYAIKSTSGNKIHLDATRPFEVSADGTITQAAAPVATLALVTFDDLGTLSKYGKTYFKAPQGVTAKPVATPEVQQGRLEDANVTAGESAVRLVSVMRQFEMLQKAVSIGSDMNKRALEQLASVGG
jgi:flagellar basal-body rod protein FlgF